MGFLTGFTLTALVLILTSPSPFHAPVGPLSGRDYFEIVSAYVAIVGAVSSVGMIAFLEVAGGTAAVYSFVDKLATTLFFMTVGGFMGVLPLLLAPFNRWGSLLVLVSELLLLMVYFVGRRLTAGRHADRAARP